MHRPTSSAEPKKIPVTLVPIKPVPDGLQVPAGTVRLPKEPTQVDNAVIVISNPALLEYLREQKPAPMVAEQ